MQSAKVIVKFFHCFLDQVNRSFLEEQAIFDVAHLDDFGGAKTRIKLFITWKALPILRLRGGF